MTLLDVRNLSVAFPGAEDHPVVQSVDLRVERGSVLGLVGETGAGKTLTTRAILGAVRGGLVSADAVVFDGVDLRGASRRQLQALRGKRIATVVQDARAALNPMQTTGRSLQILLRTHEQIGRAEARRRILAMYDAVGLQDPVGVYRAYPHELSGGMAQRVVIAAALVTNPDLLIADEATTGLDPTVQKQILDLLQGEIARRRTAAIVVSHDLGVIAQYCDEIAIMYAGRVRERGSVADVFARPAHPYSAALLAATAAGVAADRLADAATGDATAACEYVSRCPFATDRCRSGPIPLQRDGGHESLCVLPFDAPALRERTRAALTEVPRLPVGEPLLTVRDVRKAFRRGGARLHALNGVDLEIHEGETVALVGESGSGKSTLGRSILRLLDVDGGEMTFDGADILRESRSNFRRRRTDVQAVFQDPGTSLDARMRAIDVVTEPLAIFEPQLSAAQRRERGRELMLDVGLSPSLAHRYPRQLSGGQQQRLAIARAIATKPRLIVLDEPTASLDMSVRGHVLDTLDRLQREHRIAYLIISHDLPTVRRIADRVLVMYLGEIVEQGSAEDIFTRARHPYTIALRSATLAPDPDAPPAEGALPGEVPSPTALPEGCFFAGRCPLAVDACRAAHPAFVTVGDRHKARCIRTDQTAAAARASTTANGRI